MRNSDFQELPTSELLRCLKAIQKELQYRHDQNPSTPDKENPHLKANISILVDKFNLKQQNYDILNKYLYSKYVLHHKATIVDVLNLTPKNLSKMEDLDETLKSNLYSSLIQYCREYDIPYTKYPLAKPEAPNL